VYAFFAAIALGLINELPFLIIYYNSYFILCGIRVLLLEVGLLIPSLFFALLSIN